MQCSKNPYEHDDDVSQYLWSYSVYLNMLCMLEKHQKHLSLQGGNHSYFEEPEI